MSNNFVIENSMKNQNYDFFGGEGGIGARFWYFDE
jgi:hypothetical protein